MPSHVKRHARRELRRHDRYPHRRRCVRRLRHRRYDRRRRRKLDLRLCCLLTIRLPNFRPSQRRQGRQEPMQRRT
jgi:hypothetical protein